MTNSKQLYRSRTNRKLAGVCGGLGDYFNLDPTLVRIIYVFVALFSIGLGVIAYLLMWAIMPEEPLSSSKQTFNHVDDTSSKE